AKQRRLAAAVGAEQADPGAAVQLEVEAVDGERAAAVAAGEAARAHDRRRRPGAAGGPNLSPPRGHRGASPHRTAPPLMPRAIASALWRSAARYVAPLDPCGPSVSPYSGSPMRAPVCSATALA